MLINNPPRWSEKKNIDTPIGGVFDLGQVSERKNVQKWINFLPYEPLKKTEFAYEETVQADSLDHHGNRSGFSGLQHGVLHDGADLHTGVLRFMP
ncbi:hypothetical protein [Salidesulfovibrio brasiliensis]|uniref:hypothetical protein n=1 Tax=Salidesulfovibrio brasiliensis TaxID=221711 RepID=UPI001FDF22BB|nr:hypothetical protein [Salidesulfovibrio brasiliensis]